MRKTIRSVSKTVLLTLTLQFAIIGPLHALETGEWVGSVTSPNGTVVHVSYHVSSRGADLPEITLILDENEMELKVTEFSENEDKLVVSWNPGEAVTCELAFVVDNGSYAGQCVDASGTDSGRLLMLPLPKNEPEVDPGNAEVADPGIPE